MRHTRPHVREYATGERSTETPHFFLLSLGSLRFSKEEFVSNPNSDFRSASHGADFFAQCGEDNAIICCDKVLVLMY